MEIKAIRAEADYLAALQEVSALIDIDPSADSPDGERLDVLGTLVQAYEAQLYPIDPPDAIEGGCKNFCVNGQLAGNCCTSMDLQINDRHERTNRQPAG